MSVKHSPLTFTFLSVVCGRLAHIVLLVCSLAVLGTPFASAQNAVVKSTEELPAGAMQQKAITACTECHEARIIVQQRLSKPAWVKEVDKMIKWGAVVDAADHDALVDYFSDNFGVDKPPYEALRSSSAKAAGGTKPSR